MGMTLEEARTLLEDPIWPYYRDYVARTGDTTLYPKGDLRRVQYLSEKKRAAIDLWMKAIPELPAWQKVVDGAKVRELKVAFPGVYPEALKYALYFQKGKDPLPMILKLKFPEVYELCCS